MKQAFQILNGMVYFNGKCEACRPFCAAVCCRGYSFVSIRKYNCVNASFALNPAR